MWFSKDVPTIWQLLQVFFFFFLRARITRGSIQLLDSLDELETLVPHYCYDCPLSSAILTKRPRKTIIKETKVT